MTRRLIREGDPPSGQLASPVPQYWNPSTEAFEDVLGAHGAPRAILYGPNGQPISQSNPLEVRVRELEAELAAMRGMLETGNAKVTLTGSIAQSLLQYHADLDEVFMPRAVRQAGNENIWLSPPDGAIGVFIYAKAYSVTGQFGSNEGFYLRLRRQSFNSVLSSDALLDYATERHQSVDSGVSIAVFPGANEVLEGKHIKANHPLVGGLWRLGIYVSGAFGEGEGIDCEVKGHWVFK